MTQTHDQLAERLGEATLRFERCIPLFGALNDGECIGDDLKEFADDLDPEAATRLFPDFVKRLDDPTEFDSDDLLEYLMERRVLGYLVQVATPVMEQHGSQSSTFSWGYYNTRWLYAEDLAGIVDQAEAWATERRRAEAKRAGLDENDHS